MCKYMICIESWFKRWTRPKGKGQAICTLADLSRSRSELIAENLFLRQQLIVLERQVEQPKLTQRDRQVLVLPGKHNLFGLHDLHALSSPAPPDLAPETKAHFVGMPPATALGETGSDERLD